MLEAKQPSKLDTQALELGGGGADPGIPKGMALDCYSPEDFPKSATDQGASGMCCSELWKGGAQIHPGC